MQVLERDDGGLGPRSRENPGGHCRKLSASKLFRREIRSAGRRERNVHEWCEQRRMFGWVEADQTQSVFEVAEALFGRSIKAKPLPAPFGDWVERRVLQKLRGAPFDPGVRRFREPRVELLDETRLAEAGLAYDQHELAFACPSALPPACEQAQFLLAANKWRQRPCAAPS